ncbi:MAG TPA: hypothetical protein O0X95_03765 [Methanocorpusculum sp.]|nr:hypothetical protein [Methanocorpusculum sp.]
MISLPISISAAVVLLTFIFAAWQDLKTRTVIRATWYPGAVIGGICAVIFWSEFIHVRGAALVLFISVIFACLCAAFSFLGMFGKADAKALILLSLTVPVTPFAPYIFPSLAVSTLINAGVLTLFVPIIFLVYNIIKQNRAPFLLMCSGRPVSGKSVKEQFGFIAENISDENGEIQKRFVSSKDLIFSLKNNPERNTRHLREEPEKYAERLSLLERCDTVWVTFGIPLLVPLTAGLIPALFGVSAIDILLSLI